MVELHAAAGGAYFYVDGSQYMNGDAAIWAASLYEEMSGCSQGGALNLNASEAFDGIIYREAMTSFCCWQV